MVTIIDRTLTTFNTAGMTGRDLNHFCNLRQWGHKNQLTGTGCTAEFSG